MTTCKLIRGLILGLALVMSTLGPAGAQGQKSFLKSLKTYNSADFEKLLLGLKLSPREVKALTPELLTLLKGRNQGLALRAAATFAILGPKASAALPELCKILYDPKTLRPRCVPLAFTGMPKQSFEAFVKDFDKQGDYGRRMMMRVFATLRDPEQRALANPLFKKALASQDLETKSLAFQLLPLAETDWSKHVQDVKALVASKNNRIQQAAYKIVDEFSKDPLKDYLALYSKAKGESKVRLIGVIAQVMGRDPEVNPVLFAALDARSSRLRSAALEALKFRKSPAKSIVPTILEKLKVWKGKKSHRWELRKIVGLLTDYGPEAKESASALKGILYDGDELQIHVIKALANVDRSSLETFVNIYKKGDTNQRYSIISGLSRIQDPRVEQLLITAIDSKRLRRRAMNALSYQRDRGYSLYKRLVQHKDVNVRVSALVSLSSFSRLEGFEIILKSLTDKNEVIQGAAVTCFRQDSIVAHYAKDLAEAVKRLALDPARRLIVKLETCGPAASEAIPALCIVAKTHKQPQLRSFCIRALAAIGPMDKGAATQVIAARKDRDKLCQRTAYTSLRHFFGQQDLVISALAKDLELAQSASTDNDQRLFLALRALAALGQAAKSQLPALVKVMGLQKGKFKAPVLSVLCSLGPEAQPHLKPFLDEPLYALKFALQDHPENAQVIVDALFAIDKKPQLQLAVATCLRSPRLMENNFAKLIKVLRSKEYVDLWPTIMATLSKAQIPAEALATRLFELLESPDKTLSEAALKGLQTLNHRKAKVGPPLLAHLKKQVKPWPAISKISALIRSVEPETLPFAKVILEKLKDPQFQSMSQQRELIELLSFTGSEAVAAKPRLLKYMRSQNYILRFASLKACVQLAKHDPELEAAVYACAQSTVKDRGESDQAVKSLATMLEAKCPKAAETIVKILQSKGGRVGLLLSTLQALNGLPKAILEAAAGLLQSDDQILRMTAIAVLANHPSQAQPATEALFQLLAKKAKEKAGIHHELSTLRKLPKPSADRVARIRALWTQKSRTKQERILAAVVDFHWTGQAEARSFIVAALEDPFFDTKNIVISAIRGVEALYLPVFQQVLKNHRLKHVPFAVLRMLDTSGVDAKALRPYIAQLAKSQYSGGWLARKLLRRIDERS